MASVPISIGELAKRSGVAASALRFYEDKGLIKATRTASGRRVFPRSTLRRVAFIRVAQTVGLSLEDIQRSLADLPEHRTPNKADWERLAGAWRPLLERRIEAMTLLLNKLTSCIGCGCLSLQACALYNPNDAARIRGKGPRYLLGDKPQDIVSTPKKGKGLRRL
jgi:MerR family transcriptional regulator, redox-sensitive transcriptional activator SoxR